MKNKLLWIFTLLLFMVVLKLSMDVYYQQPQDVANFNVNLEQQNQRIGALNDQIVVLQRMAQQTQPPLTPTQQNLEKVENEQYLAEEYLTDYLRLVQVNMQQQQIAMALENIEKLSQKLANNNTLLGEALTQAVLAALLQDQKNIHQYIVQRTEHVMLLQQQLKKIEQQLQPQPLAPSQEKWNFSTWFNIGRAEVTPNFEERYLQFRYLQLKVLLAQQSLLLDQKDLYRAQLVDIYQQLKTYPDAQAQDILLQLKKLQNLPLNPVPQVSALALVEGQ